MERYMTIPEAAILWSVVPHDLRRACERNSIEGAFRMQRRWFIPESAVCPDIQTDNDRFPGAHDVVRSTCMIPLYH